ncbi:hypothetical protein ACROYT_G044299 [Oculina patagonica]
MSLSGNPEDEISSHTSEVLKDVNKRVEEASDILNHQPKRVSKEQKKLEHVHFSKVVKLNVGGHFFATSLETLTKDPGSMLHAMFSGRFETKPSEDGSYFIDRDGTHFRYILNYLRTGQLLVPEDKTVHRELLAEAEFYQVKGIINELTAGALMESSILSSHHSETLTDWLKDTRAFNISANGNLSCNLFPVLLYRASRNGWHAVNFHSCCDYKGPTVTVVKSGNCIFGGYAEEHWERSNSGSYKRAPDSFLFSLVNPSGLPATKMPLIAGQERNAIYCGEYNGPTFGCGPDLRISNFPNSKNCLSRLNNSYQCPPDEDPDTFLAGDRNFTISEMEVFGFKK